MANDFQIRNVPLFGNVDLSKYNADVKDYQGFVRDNSFFLNKRKVNWWKRAARSQQGIISGRQNGANWDILRDGSKIGSISREKYELTEVSDVPQVLNSAYARYTPSNKKTLVVGNQLFDYMSDRQFVQKLPNGDYIVAIPDPIAREVLISLYRGSDMYRRDEKSLSFGSLFSSEESVDFVGFFTRNGGATYTYNYDDYGDQTETDFTFELGAYEVYISFISDDGKTKAGVIYNYNNCNIYTAEDRNFIRATSSWGALSDAPGTEGTAYQRGARWYVGRSVHQPERDYYLSVMWDVVAIENNLFIEVYNYYERYERNHVRLMCNGSGVFSSTTDSGATPVIEVRDLETTTSPRTWRVSVFKNYQSSITIPSERYDMQSPNPCYWREVKNFSQKYGLFAVNFIDNVPVNIAHSFKKLVDLEGDIDSVSGRINDIVGYNSSEIYFRRGSKTYRLRIVQGSDFNEIVTSINGFYYIFNTTSYINAYFAPNDNWFCSCDDWNDRVIWGSSSSNVASGLATSRLNNNWLNSSSMKSVSDYMAPFARLLPVSASSVSAYDPSAVWDGESAVFDSSRNRVDTSSWAVGHSLNGYYYATSYEPDTYSMIPIFVDENYTLPSTVDQNGNTLRPQYDVFGERTFTPGQIGTLSKLGYLRHEDFYQSSDSGYIYAIVSEGNEQITPNLLDSEFIVFSAKLYIKTWEASYKGIVSAALGGLYTPVYLNSSEIIPISVDDAIFYINGVEYTYKNSSKRIIDFNGNVICNTELMLYIGYSTRMAYFYSEFDKAVYVFEGDNTMRKLCPLERYQLNILTSGNKKMIRTLNAPSLNLVFVALTNGFLAFFDDQYVVVLGETINDWVFDSVTGTIMINQNTLYSIIRDSLTINNPEQFPIIGVPIEIETSFYGSSDSEQNTVNDCVYLTVDNLAEVTSGAVSIHAEVLANQKVLKTSEKVVNLKTSDFNELGQCLIKYQPEYQECKGFKLVITSDFEIAELKIGTARGALNQTTKRI